MTRQKNVLRPCSQCGIPQAYNAYKNARWNKKDRLCETCKPFSGHGTRICSRVRERLLNTKKETCGAWPLGGIVYLESTFPRFCAAKRAQRHLDGECIGCTIKERPVNVIMGGMG